MQDVLVIGRNCDVFTTHLVALHCNEYQSNKWYKDYKEIENLVVFLVFCYQRPFEYQKVFVCICKHNSAIVNIK